MFIQGLNPKPLLLVISIFSSLAIFNIMALKAYVVDVENANNNVVKKISTALPQVAITFDDGPNPVITPQVLTVLKEKNAKATFFLLGKNAESYPELVQQIYAAGHEIGNHTYSHQRMTRLSQDGLKAELQHTDAILFNITGEKPRLVRPPDNAYNAKIVSQAQQCGYQFILWSIDTRDWANVSSASILRETNKTGRGDIILFHDGVMPSHTVEGLAKTIDLLQAKGFEFVTVSELMRGRN